ncbi:hypothetical protein GCM10023087_15590 [Microbacterium rhizosphaerae]
MTTVRWIFETDSGLSKVALASLPTSPVTLTAFTASPPAATAEHRSAPADADGDAVGVGDDEQPASRSAATAAADRAAIGRMRTETSRKKEEGSALILSHVRVSALGRDQQTPHNGTGMHPGVPSIGD